MKFLLVGLGNIGNEYAHTRHNIGFDVVNAFVIKHKAEFKNERLAYFASVKYRGKTLICICPTTFMNLSGKAVKYWLDKENILIEKCLVIVDDVAIALDELRLRPSGGDAGHNGLKSIEEHLLSQNYPRLRFGIGNDFPRGMQSEFVLGKWKKEEEPIVKLKIDASVKIIESFISIGIERTMNDVNNKKFQITN